MIDKSSTVLLMLDFNEQTCNMQHRPRGIASISKVKTLLTAARTAGVPVVFTLGGGGKPADIPKDLAPAGSEPAMLAGVDKFVGTDLEKILKEKGAKTVIVAGTAAHGAVLYTVSSAAMRGERPRLGCHAIGPSSSPTKHSASSRFRRIAGRTMIQARIQAAAQRA